MGYLCGCFELGKSIGVGKTVVWVGSAQLSGSRATRFGVVQKQCCEGPGRLHDQDQHLPVSATSAITKSCLELGQDESGLKSSYVLGICGFRV